MNKENLKAAIRLVRIFLSLFASERRPILQLAVKFLVQLETNDELLQAIFDLLLAKGVLKKLRSPLRGKKALALKAVGLTSEEVEDFVQAFADEKL